MSISISYKKDPAILVVTINGEMTPELYKEAMNEVLSSYEYPADVNALWDLRKMAFYNVDMAFQQKIQELRKLFSQKRGDARIALLCDNKLAESILKVFEVLSESNDIGKNLKLFKRLEEAEAWLAE